MCNDDEDGGKKVAKNSFKLNGVYLANTLCCQIRAIFSWSLFLRTVSRLKYRKNKRQSVTACGYCYSFVEHIEVKKECTKCEGRNEQL